MAKNDNDRDDFSIGRYYLEHLPSLDPKPNYDMIGRAVVHLVLTRAARVARDDRQTARVAVQFEVSPYHGPEGELGREHGYQSAGCASLMVIWESGEISDANPHLMLHIPTGGGRPSPGPKK